MGLREEQFWRLTPRVYRKLADRWYEEQKRLDLRSAVVATYVANSWLKREDQRAWVPGDFFPSLRLGKSQSTVGPGGLREDPPELIAAAWESYFADVTRAAERRAGMAPGGGFIQTQEIQAS